MIRSFSDARTEKLFNDLDVSKFRSFERVARKKLLYLHQAKNLEDLQIPPGKRLEALKGNRKGQYSIIINDQWRICFSWKGGDASDVEITDYH
jgi:toxin HigB-1